MHLVHQTLQLAQNLLLFYVCVCDVQPLLSHWVSVSCQSQLGWL